MRRGLNFHSTGIGSMWHCSVDVAYPRLSEWTRLQWALHMLVALEKGEPITCVRDGYAAFHK